MTGTDPAQSVDSAAPAFDFEQHLLQLEEEPMTLIRARYASKEEFRTGDIAIRRTADIKRATFARLVRKGLPETVTRENKDINSGKGPGSGKSFFHTRRKSSSGYLDSLNARSQWQVSPGSVSSGLVPHQPEDSNRVIAVVSFC